MSIVQIFSRCFSILNNCTVNLGFMQCSLMTYLLFPFSLLLLRYFIGIVKNGTFTLPNIAGSFGRSFSSNKKKSRNKQVIKEDM